MKRQAELLLCAVLAAAVFTAACPPPADASDSGAPPEPAEVAWLKNNAITFSTVEAGNGFDDLAGLHDIVGDARIVALGECTHGTRDVFQMKHRLIEFLATEMGFTIFSIEASTPEAYAVSDYAVHGRGDPKELIGGMYFWTWNTEEVLEMVEWMKDFNTSGAGKIVFTGFDMQKPHVAMKIVTDFLSEVDAEKKEWVMASYERIRDARERASTFGVVTYSFPVDEARGKHVKYTGAIRTEDVNGWAGLWWRVDGANRETLAFDNMIGRGPKGTTDWTEYEIELDVPAEATNINFGVLMPGEGTAWFDGLTVELDGERYNGMDDDLDFEAETLGGYASRDQAYHAALSTEHVRSGRQCLKLYSVESKSDAPKAEVGAAVSGQVLGWLKSQRDAWVAERPAEEVDWVIQNARIVNQCMRARAGNYGLVRDACMADNVAWIAEQNPDARIVLWAHNGHVGRGPGTMGAHLAEQFGDDYLPIGFAAGRGTYYAMGGNGSTNRIHELSPPPPGSIESFFAAAKAPRLVLDLRRAGAGTETDPGGRWLHEERPFRSIGAVAMDNQFFPAIVAERFDVLVYFDDTESARQLDTRPKQ